MAYIGDMVLRVIVPFAIPMSSEPVNGGTVVKRLVKPFPKRVASNELQNSANLL